MKFAKWIFFFMTMVLTTEFAISGLLVMSQFQPTYKQIILMVVILVSMAWVITDLLLVKHPWKRN